jgi:hypothetical protein
MKAILIPIMAVVMATGCTTVQDMDRDGVFKNTLVKIVEVGTSVLINKLVAFESTESSAGEVDQALRYYNRAIADGIVEPLQIISRYGEPNRVIQNANAAYIDYLQDTREQAGLIHLRSIIKGIQEAKE